MMLRNDNMKRAMLLTLALFVVIPVNASAAVPEETKLYELAAGV